MTRTDKLINFLAVWNWNRTVLSMLVLLIAIWVPGYWGTLLFGVSIGLFIGEYLPRPTK